MYINSFEHTWEGRCRVLNHISVLFFVHFYKSIQLIFIYLPLRRNQRLKLSHRLFLPLVFIFYLFTAIITLVFFILLLIIKIFNLVILLSLFMQMLEPFRAKLFRNCVFFRIPERICLVEVRKYVAG